MDKNISQFKNELEIKLHFVSPWLKKWGNIIQAQTPDGLYHYLVENMQGWNDTGITSISSEFFTHEEN